MAGSAFLHPEKLMDAAGVRFGNHVADIGTGRTGHLVFPLASRVGEEGRVYAVDIDPEAVGMVEGLRRQRGISHVHAIWGDAEMPGGVGITSGSLDVAFLVNTLWTMRDLARMSAEVGRLMREDGRIFVLDWGMNSLHPLTPPREYLQHPEVIDLAFRSAKWHPAYTVRISPYHWGRAYERL